MPLYTRDSIERLRDAVDMLDLVGTKTELRRIGAQWAGLCPFHDELKPSFSVNADAKVFYCFGCGAKGDAFGFVEQTEELPFREAVELLAGRYGVQLESERDPYAEWRSPAEKRPTPRRSSDRRVSISPQRLARARNELGRYAEHCHELVTTHEAYRARRWLYGRGLTDAEIAEHRIGFDPGYRALGRRHRTPPAVTLPVFDDTGAVTYVQARVLEPASDAPKFLNPSSKWIGPSPRVSAIRSPATVDRSVLVVCEGLCDGILAARYFETRALIGARQPDDAVVDQLLEAAGDRPIVLCLDSDSAGLAGAKQLLGWIAERGGRGASVPLPAEDLTDFMLDAGERFEDVFRGLVGSTAERAQAGQAHDPMDRSTLDPILQYGHLLGFRRIALVEDEIAPRDGSPARLGDRSPPFDGLDPDDALETLRLERRGSVVTAVLRRDRREAAELDRLASSLTAEARRHHDDLARTVRDLISDGGVELRRIEDQQRELHASGRALDARLSLTTVADWVVAERQARGHTGPAVAIDHARGAVEPRGVESCEAMLGR